MTPRRMGLAVGVVAALAVGGAAPAAAQRVVAPSVTLTLRGDPGLRFNYDVGVARLLRLQREAALHRETATIAGTDAVTTLVCRVPCETELAAGVYRFRLGDRVTRSQDSNEVLLTPGAHVLVGHYASRADLRLAGGVLFAVTLLSSIVFGLLITLDPLFTIGLAASLAGLGISFGLMELRDDASVVVDPV